MRSLFALFLQAFTRWKKQKNVYYLRIKFQIDLYWKFDRIEAEGKNLDKEKIPVWVWYEDIDQKQVDKEVAEQTGLSQENLSVDYEMPNPSLISDLQNQKIGSQEKMHDYLGRTTVARNLERQRTEAYTTKRREVCRKKYIFENINRLKDIKVKNEDVIFSSEYSPCAIINLTKKEIEALIVNNNIKNVDLFNEQVPEPDTESSVLESSNINKVRTNIGLSGKNVKIGLIDNGLPAPSENLNLDNIFAVNITNIYDHATRMALTIMGKNGVAPDAELYCTSYSLSNIERLVAEGVI